MASLGVYRTEATGSRRLCSEWLSGNGLDDA